MKKDKGGSKKFTAIDFFCGGGGMTCGLQQGGVKVIAGVDFDPDAKETYEANNEGTVFVQADITQLDLGHFEKNFGVKKNDDHLILVGCSPCQFYSIIRTTKEKSKKSKDLLNDFRRFVEYYKPGYVLVENVPGIQTNKETVLPEFLDFLKKNGYSHLVYRVVDMSYYGVPQGRKRFSLLASRVSAVKLPEKGARKMVLKEAIGIENGFSKIEAGHRDGTDFKHTSASLGEKTLARLKKTPKNGGSRFAWKDDKKLQLKCYVGKDNSFRDTFGRMSWNKPAATITTKFFSVSNGRFAHPEENRPLSLREGATLQTFPKTYVFKTKSIATTAKLIGNAVPPEYARRLAQVICEGVK